METHEAMIQAMTMGLQEMADKMGIPYNTAASYRYKFRRHQLSLEKQIEILTKLNFQPITNLTWKSNQR
jgi:hypothetical protein